MKKSILILVIAMAMLLSLSSVFAQALKPILVELYDFGGSFPGNVIYPAAGTISYNVYVTARPADVQTGPSASCTAGMDVGKFVLSYNMGNFSLPWTVGETLHMDILQTTTGRISTVEFLISTGNFPQFQFDALGVALIDPPTVLFNTNAPQNNLMGNFGLTNVTNTAGVWQGTGWSLNDYWSASFSTAGCTDLNLTSKIRRQYMFDDVDLFDDVWGPRLFRTYYSTDGGTIWTQYPAVNYTLGADQNWLTIAFDLPAALNGLPNVMIKWAMWNANGPANDGWGEIKDVKVTGISSGPEHTWNYNLQFTVPVLVPAATINGIGAPYLFTDHDDLEPNTLLGEYTISAAPAGYHWVPASYTLVAEDFVLAKTAYVYNAAKTFVLEEDAPVYDYPVDTPVVVAPGVTIEVADGNGNDVLIVPAAVEGEAGYYPPTPVQLHGAVVHQQIVQLLGAGPWTINYTSLAPFGAWYSYNTGLWTIVPSVGGVVVFTIPVGGKDIPEVPIVLKDGPLPVEFSSFAATLTAQNFVKLTWVTETETSLSGYRVYRNDSADQATAVAISGLLEPTNTSQTQTYTHIDNEVTPETTYSYWLEVVEMDGSTAFHGPTTVYVELPAEVVPSLVTNMGNAYPNPFKANSSTNIAYEVKAGEAGTITIYNIVGQVVKTVPVTETTAPKTFKWNGRDSKGNACGSGIYFYKLSTPSRNVTKKMVIVN
ncbi:MAG: T9SS type A sorting domain-containing protein [Candidatus Cloacimonetes bacterium]|nr:T9SS type A sorting domain-containing protein [Candidatus Cloacimonadota bacterium]